MSQIKYFILLLAVAGVGFLIYQFAAPYILDLLLHRSTIARYESLRSGGLAWEVFDVSERGNNIYVLELGQGGNTTLIFGAFHGDEQTGFHLVTQLAETLAAKPELLNEDARVILAPALNPDGMLKRTRTNANGVDINRNFPTQNWTAQYEKKKNFPGQKPASEKETRVAMVMIEQYRPDKIISIHEDLRMNNINGPARALGERMAKYNYYPVTEDVGYPTPGSFGNYGGTERQIPLVTLELPDIWPGKAWKQNRDALLAAINSN
jgi:protein MpaA